jgi:hypothetical protein
MFGKKSTEQKTLIRKINRQPYEGGFHCPWHRSKRLGKFKHFYYSTKILIPLKCFYKVLVHEYSEGALLFSTNNNHGS